MHGRPGNRKPQTWFKLILDWQHLKMFGRSISINSPEKGIFFLGLKNQPSIFLRTKGSTQLKHKGKRNQESESVTDPQILELPTTDYRTAVPTLGQEMKDKVKHNEMSSTGREDDYTVVCLCSEIAHSHENECTIAKYTNTD